jgi:restriction system protein
MTDRTIWGIHMRREHGLAPIEQGYVAIGWREMGDLSLIQPTREAFKAAYERAYPNSKEQTVRTSAGVPYRFLVEMKPGDIVIFPSKPDRMVNIGVIEGGYPTMHSALIAPAPWYCAARRTHWGRNNSRVPPGDNVPTDQRSWRRGHPS